MRTNSRKTKTRKYLSLDVRPSSAGFYKIRIAHQSHRTSRFGGDGSSSWVASNGVELRSNGAPSFSNPEYVGVRGQDLEGDWRWEVVPEDHGKSIVAAVRDYNEYFYGDSGDWCIIGALPHPTAGAPERDSPRRRRTSSGPTSRWSMVRMATASPLRIFLTTLACIGFLGVGLWAAQELYTDYLCSKTAFQGVVVEAGVSVLGTSSNAVWQYRFEGSPLYFLPAKAQVRPVVGIVGRRCRAKHFHVLYPDQRNIEGVAPPRAKE